MADGPTLGFWAYAAKNPDKLCIVDPDHTEHTFGDVLARGKSSRLYRKLVIEEQIAQDVTAYQSGRELAGSFAIVVTLRPSRSQSGRSSICTC